MFGEERKYTTKFGIYIPSSRVNNSPHIRQSGIQLKESGIPLRIGIRKTVLEFLESLAWNAESKTV